MKIKKMAITLPAPLCIVATITLFMTYLNHGFSHDFISQWLCAFAFSVVIVLPLAGVLIVNVSKWVETSLLPNAKPLYQKLVQCVFIAVGIESVISVVTTLTTVHVANAQEFLSVWAMTLVRALPLGYVIGMMMVFVVKPRISRALARA